MVAPNASNRNASGSTTFGPQVVVEEVWRTRGVYLSRAGREVLQRIQAELADHLASGTDGRCTGCRELEPCRRRNELTDELLRYGCLPQRRPGCTHTTDRRPFEWPPS